MGSQREIAFLRRAIERAAESARAGSGPFGAVIARGDEVIAEGSNRVTSTHDPTAHAEVVAIRRACEKLGSHQLAGCEIFTSCEPCPMCLGAIYWARLERIYFAADRSDAAAAGFDDEVFYREIGRAPEVRAVAAVQLLSEEGQAPLRIWLDNDHRIPY